MKRAAGLFLALALSPAGALLAQDPGMSGGGMQMQAPQDHWITADSLVKALGISDPTVKDKVAPHLAEVDKILKTAADERKMSMSAGSMPPAKSTPGEWAAKSAETQKALDTHLGAIRAALPEANRAAFDAMQKPMLKVKPEMKWKPTDE